MRFRDPGSRSFARKQPGANGTGQIGRIVLLDARGIDLRYQCADRHAFLNGGIAQRIPEDRLEADRSGVTSDDDRSLDRAGHCRPQYMCWPPLIDSVEPVMKPASSPQRKTTPRAISSAWPRR